jgi:hypothetical protein
MCCVCWAFLSGFQLSLSQSLLAHVYYNPKVYCYCLTKQMLIGLDSTFDTLYSDFARKWHEQDNVVYLFHCPKNIHVVTVWTFNLDNDFLRFEKRDQCRWAALSIVRQRPLTTSDFDLYEPSTPPGLTRTQPYEGTTLKRQNSTRLERRKALVFRILTNFAFQWSHILCGPYNNSTFWRLARAIISIVTLDFNVAESAIPRSGYGGLLVRKDSLPEWDPLSEGIVRIGRTPIVICQHISDAITLIRANFAEQELVALETGSPIPEEGIAYLIFSERTILLYQINGDSEGHTEAEYLFGEPRRDGEEISLDSTACEACEMLLAGSWSHTICPKR